MSRSILYLYFKFNKIMPKATKVSKREVKTTDCTVCEQLDRKRCSCYTDSKIFGLNNPGSRVRKNYLNMYNKTK